MVKASIFDSGGLYETIQNEVNGTIGHNCLGSFLYKLTVYKFPSNGAGHVTAVNPADHDALRQFLADHGFYVSTKLLKLALPPVRY